MNTSNAIALAAAWSLLLLSGCNTSEPTMAVLSNDYPSASAAGSSEGLPVYKGWWSVSQFPDPVPAGQVSDPVRVVPSSDYGYALLAPGWDPASDQPPATLIALRSAEKLVVSRGELLTFVVSAQKTMGDCAAGKPLTQDEADYVTSRIFAAEFSNRSYDAPSCTTSVVPAFESGAAGEPGSR